MTNTEVAAELLDWFEENGHGQQIAVEAMAIAIGIILKSIAPHDRQHFLEGVKIVTSMIAKGKYDQ